MNREEKAEMAALFDQYIIPCAEAGASSSAIGRAWYELLREAESAGRAWAAEFIDGLVMKGATDDATSRTKTLRVSYRGSQGEGRSMPLIRGLRKRDEDGRVAFIQMALPGFSHKELKEHIALIGAQIGVQAENLDALRRLDAVYAMHPEAGTLSEACALVGTTIDAVLRIAA